MSYQLPIRLYFISSTANPLILKVGILAINNSLLLEYSLYETYNDEKIGYVQLEKQLFNNPEDNDLFNRLNKKLKYSNRLSINEINNLYIYLQGKLAEITNQQLSIQINLIFDNKLVSISLMPFQVVSLSSFTLSLAQNYELFKLKILDILEKEKVEQKEVIINEIQEPTIISEPALELLKQDPKEPVILLNEVIGLAPSNLTIYYLTKILNSLTDNITIVDNVIHLEPLFNLCLTKQNELLIYHQILEINQSKEELIDRCKQLFKALNIIVSSNDCKPNTHNIYIIIYLLFLYTLKINHEITALNLSYNLKASFAFVVNKALTSLAQVFKLEKPIQIQFNKTNSNANNKLSSENFDLIIKKHQYLTNIDKKAFIDAVLGDLSELNVSEPKAVIKFQPKFLTAGTLINIDAILASNNVGNSLIGYMLVKDSFITKEYFDLYQLYSANLPPLDNNLNKIIKLYYTQLIKILNDLENNNMLNLNNISTLFLIDNFVLPNDITEFYDQLFILYRIIIPALYHNKGCTNFIDYFH